MLILTTDFRCFSLALIHSHVHNRVVVIDVVGAAGIRLVLGNESKSGNSQSAVSMKALLANESWDAGDIE